MAGLKEIRRRISSVKNTKQITRAMKLVSAAKLRRAQDAAERGRSFGQKLQNIIGTLKSEMSGELVHPLLQNREQIKRRRIIAISGERGLCGAYNANVIKAIQAQELGNQNVSLDFIAMGRRTASTLARLGWNIVDQHVGLVEDANKWPIEQIIDSVCHDFINGSCDEVVIYYTKFISAMTQKVERTVLLPIGSEENLGHVSSHQGGQTKFSPDPEKILTELIPLLVKAKLRQAGLESKASEHAARMTAMDSATNNANDLIEKLRLYYNRARQSAITRELIDIVGGAEAIQ